MGTQKERGHFNDWSPRNATNQPEPLYKRKIKKRGKSTYNVSQRGDRVSKGGFYYSVLNEGLPGSILKKKKVQRKNKRIKQLKLSTHLQGLGPWSARGKRTGGRECGTRGGGDQRPCGSGRRPSKEVSNRPIARKGKHGWKKKGWEGKVTKKVPGQTIAKNSVGIKNLKRGEAGHVKKAEDATYQTTVTRSKTGEPNYRE